MTTTSIPALLEPIQERLDAATPGPWESKGIANGRSDLFVNGDYYGGKKSVATAADSEFGACSDNDAEFIANAPTDTARLLAAVKAVSDLADAWQARGEHLIQSAEGAPDDIAEALSDDGHDFKHKASFIRSAVEAALGGL